MVVRSSSSFRNRRRRVYRHAQTVMLSVAVVSLPLIFRAVLSDPVTPPSVHAVVSRFDEIQVPVPREVVPAGRRIKDVEFDTASYPVHQLPHGAIRDLTAFEDAVATTALPARMPVFPENLSPLEYGSNALIERIPPGMRAMTLRVDETTSIEGWAGSGAVVDVLLIQSAKTSVVAERVKILSAERSLDPHPEIPKVPSTVTLLVTQEQCLAIHTALPLGRIAFALRSNRDDSQWTLTSFSADKLRFHGRPPTATTPITGYVSVSLEGESGAAQEFALSGNKWIPTDSIPDGFFPARRAREERSAP